MKKQDIKEMKAIVVTDQLVKVPTGWEVVKEPTKMTENGVDIFKAVIGKS